MVCSNNIFGYSLSLPFKLFEILNFVFNSKSQDFIVVVKLDISIEAAQGM